MGYAHLGIAIATEVIGPIAAQLVFEDEPLMNEQVHPR
jgi:hypothetical protein